MRVFVVGATGVVGRRLVPLLVATGHDVIASATTPGKLTLIEQMKADAVQLDVLDATATREAIKDTKPDVIVHQATALAHLSNNFRNMDRIFAKTNQLRTTGTRNLLAAAEEFGVQRIIAQSYCGWPYPREGSWVKTENDPLDAHPLPAARQTIAAIAEQETLISEAGGVVLRYGGFYGPGTSLAPGGPQYEAVRKLMLPIVGDGAGIISFIHVDDAATAALAALTNGRGVYNIVDDEPAPEREWLPYLASAIGAKPPRHVPTWLARLAAGEIAVEMMTKGRGGSNVKAKAELSWRPQYASWRDGFKNGLG
jgi:nucleoside-diphosphate-sugar epimerase